jgi:hypothetical protein
MATSAENPPPDVNDNKKEESRPETFPVNVTLPDGCGEIPFPFVPLDDFGGTLRQLLAEHPQSCMFSAYHVVVRKDETSEPTTLTESFDIVAFMDLDAGCEDPRPLQATMVLDPYTVRTIRKHLLRFEDVLLRHPPVFMTASGASSSGSPDDDSDAQPDPLKSGLCMAAAIMQSDVEGVSLVRLIEQEKTLSATAAAQCGAPSIPVPVSLQAVFPLLIAGSASTTENPNSVPAAPLPTCLRSVTLSSFNPPPAPRLMQGDLVYLRIETLEGRVLHVTGTGAGFFVNRSTDDGTFDASAAHPPLHSRTLWTLLHRASNLFRVSYAALLQQAAETARAAARVEEGGAAGRGELAGLSSMYGVVAVPDAAAATLAGPGASPFLTSSDSVLYAGAALPAAPASLFGMSLAPAGSFAFTRAPWLAPATPPLHTSAPRRAEDALLCTFGMDDRGALRDWNEEWASVQELPTTTLSERLLRARARARVLADFVDAATQGAVAIVQGHVPPLNPSEATRMHVFV